MRVQKTFLCLLFVIAVFRSTAADKSDHAQHWNKKKVFALTVGGISATCLMIYALRHHHAERAKSSGFFSRWPGHTSGGSGRSSGSSWSPKRFFAYAGLCFAAVGFIKLLLKRYAPEQDPRSGQGKYADGDAQTDINEHPLPTLIQPCAPVCYTPELGAEKNNEHKVVVCTDAGAGGGPVIVHTDIGVGEPVAHGVERSMQADDMEYLIDQERLSRLLAVGRRLGQDADGFDVQDPDLLVQRVEDTAAIILRERLLNRIKIIGVRVFCLSHIFAAYSDSARKHVAGPEQVLIELKGLAGCLPQEIEKLKILLGLLHEQNDTQYDRLVAGVIETLGRFHEDLSSRDIACGYRAWNTLKSAIEGVLGVLKKNLPAELMKDVETYWRPAT